jgi:DNA polymerase-1
VIEGVTERVTEGVTELLDRLRDAGVGRGSLLAVTVTASGAVGLAAEGISVAADVEGVARIEDALRPRWLTWSNETATALAFSGVRLSTCWDLAAVHRLLFGGWQTSPALIWSALADLPAGSIPSDGQLDLLAHVGDEGVDEQDPVQPDGHLRPAWTGGGWARTPTRTVRWAATALAAGALQRSRLAQLNVGGDALACARSESAADLLCAELQADGLPVDVARAEQLIGSYIGARPRDEADAVLIRQRRDALVLSQVRTGDDVDLRNPAQVRSMLARAGIDVPDTRSWRLERFRGAHPVVEALLTWRKAERIATTYGYGWLDANVSGGRLRGGWSGSDGAAGRMTASAGLHNMPAELRPAVVAEPGFVFVRADLGQIEPRVLAAVSGDRALAGATQDDDLYAPVAARLKVDRPIAKVAVLAAMYGQTSGAAGEALKGLESAYPVAMRYLRDAYDEGRSARDVRTFGGRLVRMWPSPPGLDEAAARSTAAARGRYARNAVIQGAAAELFKAWAATVRTRTASLGAQIVLCLHDELLVHVPIAHGEAVATALVRCLEESARGWAPDGSVRFVANVSVIERWSDAKG